MQTYGFVILLLLTVFIVTEIRECNGDTVTYGVPTNKVDSLQSVVDSLEVHIKSLETELDKNEKHFDYVIADYNLGIDYIKQHHPLVYKDFHRMIGMSDQYTREIENENKRRWAKK